MFFLREKRFHLDLFDCMYYTRLIIVIIIVRGLKFSLVIASKGRDLHTKNERLGQSTEEESAEEESITFTPPSNRENYPKSLNDTSLNNIRDRTSSIMIFPEILKNPECLSKPRLLVHVPHVLIPWHRYTNRTFPFFLLLKTSNYTSQKKLRTF